MSGFGTVEQEAPRWMAAVVVLAVVVGVLFGIWTFAGLT